MIVTNITIVGIPALSKAILNYHDPYRPFLPLFSQSTNPQDPIPLLTSTVLTTLMAASASASPNGTPTTDTALPKLLSYLANLTKSSDGGLQDIGVLEYSALLRGKKSRELFWAQRKETVGPLIDILKAAAGVSSDSSSTLWSGATSVRSGFDGALSGGVGLQLLYHVLLVLWQLSFEAATIGEGLEEYVSPLVVRRHFTNNSQ